MFKKKRNTRTSQDQYNIYVRYLIKYPKVLENKIDVRDPDYLKNKWAALAEILNSSAGSRHNVSGWKLTLRSWRSDVRRKGRCLSEGPSSKKLSWAENKFLEITSPETLDQADTILYENSQISVVEAEDASDDVIEPFEANTVKIEVSDSMESLDSIEVHGQENPEDENSIPMSESSENNQQEIRNSFLKACSKINAELEDIPIGEFSMINHEYLKSATRSSSTYKIQNNLKKTMKRTLYKQNSNSPRSTDMKSEETKTIAEALQLVASNMSRMADSMSSISHSQWKMAEAQMKIAAAKEIMVQAKLAKYKYNK